MKTALAGRHAQPFEQVVPARKVAKAAAPRVLKRAAKEPSIAHTFDEAYSFREQPGGGDA